MEPRKRPHNPNPQAKAFFLSKPIFCWLQRVFHTSSKRPLDEADLYDVLPEDSSIKLSNTLSRQWEKQLYKSKTGDEYSLKSALFTCYLPSVVALNILFCFVECLRLGQAVFLGLVLSYFEEDSSLDWFMAYMYALGWSLCFILVTILDNIALHKSHYVGLRMRVAVTSIIYRKILRLSNYAIQDSNTSNIVNLLSADANSFDQSCLAFSYVWLSLVETIVVMILLWIHVGLGPYCLVGLLLIIIVTPIQYAIGKFLSNLRLKVAELTDRRVRQVNEILSGIKCIKMNCWEKPFSTLIRTVRSAEYVYLRTICHCRGLNYAFFSMTGKFLAFSTLTVYMLMGQPITPSALFTTVALYEALRTSVSLLWPWSLRYIKESNTALHNIQEFLLLEERNTVETPAQLSLLKMSPLPENVTLRFEDYTASWNRNRDNKNITLDSLNFSVFKGQLVAITGLPGSGKSSVLNSVLGELPRLGGFVRSRGKLAFVPTSNWVFSSTFRENVMFGLEMDRRKYNKVLYACALVKDLDTLTYNDLTHVGEKGTSLTAGQKAKIGLARAVYQGADVYLVDDIFSTVDERDAAHIFTKCFCGLLSTKTVILVTHNIQFLKAADEIIVMNRGRMSHKGSYDCLTKRGVRFKNIIPDYSQEDVSVNDENKAVNTMEKESTTMRQKLWLDHFYSSHEALDKIWLQFEDTSDSDSLTIDEDKDPTVRATWRTYLKYFTMGGGGCGVFPFAVLCLLTQITYMLCDWWLYHWSRSHWNIIFSSSLPTSLSYSTTTTSANVTSSPTSLPVQSNTRPNLYSITLISPTIEYYVYVGLFLGYVFLVFIRQTVFNVVATRASKYLHEEMFRGVLRAPMAFFEKNSAGKILSRFGRDLSFADNSIAATMSDVVQLLSLGAIVMIAAANYWLVIVIVPLITLFLYGRFHFLTTAKNLKQLEQTTKTPVYQHLSNTLEGMWTVRAFGAEDRFLKYFDTYMDRHTAAAYLYLAANRWFSIRMDLLSVFLVSLLAFGSIVVHNYTAIDPGLLGLAMLYAINLLPLGQYSVRQSIELNNQMNGIARMLPYCKIKPEPLIITPTRPSQVWPQYGIVTFEGVSLVYGDDNSRGLRNLWCCFRSEEKVGVVGHPEVCKKALVAAILRLAQPSGTIRIDGLDITEIGLQDLREKITVIPMEPILFGGSMRRNLDPFSRHPDVHLWRALELVQLKEKVENIPGQMYADMADYGDNFSLGERQLVCMARGLLRPSKVLIYEETPSIIKPRYERLIHHIIQTKFKASTVIIIAQRLQGVIDTDRVMMLHDGKVKEFDSPHLLLENSKSHFYKLVNTTAQQRMPLYKQIAKDRYENKPYQAPPQALGGDGVMPYAGGRNSKKYFLPSFHNNRLSGVLNNFSGGNQFSANRF